MSEPAADAPPRSEPVPYLSDEWLDLADAAVSDLTPAGGSLSIGYRIDGGPPGTSAHRLTLGPDRVGYDRAGESATVTLTMGWAVAVGVARGDVSAQQAVLDGRITLDGDTGRLLDHAEALAGIEDRLAPLRARTRWDKAR